MPMINREKSKRVWERRKKKKKKGCGQQLENGVLRSAAGY